MPRPHQLLHLLELLPREDGRHFHRDYLVVRLVLLLAPAVDVEPMLAEVCGAGENLMDRTNAPSAAL